MPEWLRPSGTFGIGLQSVFMWTDEIHIKTQSIQGEPRLHITLHSPTGIKKGLATLEKVEDNNIIKKSGSELSFEIESLLPKRWSISLNSMTGKEYSKHDWLLDHDFPLNIIKLVDEVNDFSQNSLINIDVIYDGKKQKSGKKQELNDKKIEEIFFQETNSFFDITLDNIIDENSISYRGQIIKEKNKDYQFFKYHIDLYSAKASDWVKINRNELSDEGLNHIEDIIGQNLALWIKRNKTKISESSQSEAIVSLLSDIWKEKTPSELWNSNFKHYEYAWKKIQCFFNENNKKIYTVDECMKVGTKVILDLINGYNESNDGKILFYCCFSSSDLLKISNILLIDWLKSSPKNGIRYLFDVMLYGYSANGNNIDGYKVGFAELIECDDSCINQISITKEIFSYYVEHEIKQVNFGTNRLFTPLIKDMRFLPNINDIFLDDDAKFKGNFIKIIPYYLNETPAILLPFEFKKENITLTRFDEFILAVKPLLKNQELSLFEIRKIYNDLIEFFDNDLMKDSDIWKKYRGLASND